MDIQVSGTLLVGVLALIVLMTIGMIIAVKMTFKSRSEQFQAGTREKKATKSPIEGRTKYPELDTFKLSGTFLNYGLLVTIVMMILAFGWTQYDQVIDVSAYLGDLQEEIEMETPRTAEPPPPPPPPPPPVIQEIPNDVSVEETVTFESQDINDETEVEAPKIENKPPPPPPPPPPPKKESDEIFKVVEDNPAFPGCEDLRDKAEKKKCAEEKMLQFIYGNIKYPAIARENGVEGMVVVTFVVEKDGSITAAEVLRDIGAGCGQEALRVVNMMPKWEPGKQRGRPVRVQFNLPVRFKLE